MSSSHTPDPPSRKRDQGNPTILKRVAMVIAVPFLLKPVLKAWVIVTLFLSALILRIDMHPTFVLATVLGSCVAVYMVIITLILLFSMYWREVDLESLKHPRHRRPTVKLSLYNDDDWFVN